MSFCIRGVRAQFRLIILTIAKTCIIVIHVMYKKTLLIFMLGLRKPSGSGLSGVFHEPRHQNEPEM